MREELNFGRKGLGFHSPSAILPELLSQLTPVIAKRGCAMPSSRSKPTPFASKRPSMGTTQSGRDCEKSFYAGNCEPSLGDLLDDPILRRLMDSDGIDHEQLWHLIDETRVRLAQAW
jgi:hypothetical protein